MILIISISSYWISILYGPISFIPKRLASSYNCIPLVYSDNNISIVYYLVFLCVTNLNSQNGFSFIIFLWLSLSIPLHLFHCSFLYLKIDIVFNILCFWHFLSKKNFWFLVTRKSFNDIIFIHTWFDLKISLILRPICVKFTW